MSESAERQRTGLFAMFAVIGPGIAMAATGIGAGDMVTAVQAGVRFGTALLWAAVFGAVLKYFLNEGVARWQLATGSSILEGWAHELGRPVSYAFVAYLLVWSFSVAGALIAACGLAGEALFGGLPLWAWGVIHSVVAVALVLVGRYQLFENLMKVFIALLFVVFVYSAAQRGGEWRVVLAHSLLPAIPDVEAIPFILAVIGGVGGSVTLLSYGYWIREKGWVARDHLRLVRVDLATAYVITGLFGVAVMIVAAGVDPGEARRTQLVIAVADELGDLGGPAARSLFLVGFWGAVFSSMLGVWQGIPYLFADFAQILLEKRRDAPADELAAATNVRSPWYWGYLLFLAGPPMILLRFDRPGIVIFVYAVISALFMPFLAGTLLYLNGSPRRVGKLVSSPFTTAFLLAAILVFGYLVIPTAAREWTRLTGG